MKKWGGGANPIGGVEPGGLIEVYASPMFMKLNMIKKLVLSSIHHHVFHVL